MSGGIVMVGDSWKAMWKVPSVGWDAVHFNRSGNMREEVCIRARPA